MLIRRGGSGKIVTADKVVDASALAAVLFVEPEGATMNARMQDSTLHAPALLRFEMANIAIKKLRKTPLNRATILQQHDSSLGIPLKEYSVDEREVLALAERFNLTAYDASYLWLARHLGCDLLTLDGDLLAAANAI
jgi:predicted nucleic acid-binding protein